MQNFSSKLFLLKEIHLKSVMILALIFCSVSVYSQDANLYGDPNILTEDDPTTFDSLKNSGRANRRVADRRTPGYPTLNVYVYTASFDDMDETMDVLVNPEFDAKSAREESEKYLSVIGQIPLVLRRELKVIYIHKGNELFSGGNNSKGEGTVEIHTGKGLEYDSKGILEEILFHEATHAAFQNTYNKSSEWLNAQKKDKYFISKYGRDNPQREDMAESFLWFVAITYKADRLPEKTQILVEKTISHRIEYFSGLELEMNPVDSNSQEPVNKNTN